VTFEVIIAMLWELTSFKRHFPTLRTIPQIFEPSASLCHAPPTYSSKRLYQTTRRHFARHCSVSWPLLLLQLVQQHVPMFVRHDFVMGLEFLVPDIEKWEGSLRDSGGGSAGDAGQ